jgi:hypothetical protein
MHDIFTSPPYLLLLSNSLIYLSKFDSVSYYFSSSPIRTHLFDNFRTSVIAVHMWEKVLRS